jgi:hypothetical protein
LGNKQAKTNKGIDEKSRMICIVADIWERLVSICINTVAALLAVAHRSVLLAPS